MPVDLQQELPAAPLVLGCVWGSIEAVGSHGRVTGTSRGKQESPGGPGGDAACLEGDGFPKTTPPTPCGKQPPQLLPLSRAQFPVPASFPAHPAQPEKQPQSNKADTPQGNPLPSNLPASCLGRIIICFFPGFFFSSPKSGWSFTPPDSISRLSHPLPSGRLPDGAPLGHICSLFGKQGLIQVLS